MLTVLPCSASWSALTQPLDLTLDLLLHDCRLLEYTDPLKHYARLYIENIVHSNYVSSLGAVMSFKITNMRWTFTSS